MPVDVVVVDFHTSDLLFDFIDSYHQHKFDGCTLTVVEVEPLDKIPYAGIDSLIETESNVGYGDACNKGAVLGTNDVLLFANADTLLTEDFIACHDALLAHDDWGVLGPRQVNEQGAIVAGGIFGPDRAPAQRGWNEQDRGQYSDIRDDAAFVSGALLFIKRDVWDELTACSLYQEAQPGSVGAMLQTPHYFEDTFLGYHVRDHGYKCVFYGPARMVHLWHRGSAHGGWADMQFDRSREMYRRACQMHGIEHE